MLTTADPERFASEPWWMKGLDVAASPVRTLISQPLKEAGEATSTALASPNLLQDPYAQHQLSSAMLNFGARASAVPRPAGSLGVFGGVEAVTSDIGRLAEAQHLSAAGHPLSSIWENTGWNKGPGGDWRFEIPDTPAKLTWPSGQRPQWSPTDPVLLQSMTGNYKLDKVLDHPDLYKAYPELRDIDVNTYPPHALSSYAGHYDPDTKSITLDPRSPEDTLSTLLHETQHAVQHIEGFPRGGNPTEFYPPGFQQEYNQTYDKWLPYNNIIDATGLSSTQMYNALKAQEAGTMRPGHEKVLDKFRDGILDMGAPFNMDDFTAGFMHSHEYLHDLIKIKGQAEDRYSNLAGEIEARMVQERASPVVGRRYTPEELAQIPPQGTRGYPQKGVITIKRWNEP
jgi:hypothetical protein